MGELAHSCILGPEATLAAIQAVGREPDPFVGWLAGRIRRVLPLLRAGGSVLLWSLPRMGGRAASALESAGLAIEDRLTLLVPTADLARALPAPFLLDESPVGIEDVWLARKPGGSPYLGVEDSRVGTSKRVPSSPARAPMKNTYGNLRNDPLTGSGANPNVGRWPAHLLIVHAATCSTETCSPDCPAALVGAQSGNRGPTLIEKACSTAGKASGYGGGLRNDRGPRGYADEGTASRFFPQIRPSMVKDFRDSDLLPVELIRWLVRMTTPIGGFVLAPFDDRETIARAAAAERRFTLQTEEGVAHGA